MNRTALLVGLVCGALIHNSASAQNADGIQFPAYPRSDPTYSTDRYVTFDPVSYVYACNQIWPFNQIFSLGLMDAQQRYQELREDPNSVIGGCDYLRSGDTNQFAPYGGLVLRPMVHPNLAKPVPRHFQRIDGVPEVALVYFGLYANSDEGFYVVLAHPVYNGEIQWHIGRDLVSAIYGG